MQEEKLAALVKELGVERQVILQGYTEDLPGALGRSSVYAMASLSEGFPMVLIEAMSLGLPLIPYDCPRGPAEIIRHEKNGLLIENHRHRVYTRGLMRLVEDAELREQLGQIRRLESARLEVDDIDLPRRVTLDLFCGHVDPEAGLARCDQDRVIVADPIDGPRPETRDEAEQPVLPGDAR